MLIVAGPFVVAATMLTWRGRKAATVVVLPLLLVAFFIGFVLSSLAHLSRCTTCDEA